MNMKIKSSSARIRRLARPRGGVITPKFQACYLPPCSYMCPVNRRIRPLSCRMRQLAIPRRTNPKYIPEPPREYKRPSLQLNGPQISTRLDQLSTPKLSSLLRTKKEYRKFLKKVDPERLKIFNQHIQKSMHTVYTRIANVKLPEKTDKSKWDLCDWKKHYCWLAHRSDPKPVFKPPPIVRKAKPINQTHMAALSKPTKVVEPYKGPTTKISDPIRPISKAVLNFVMTPTYIRLATPFKKKDDPPEFEPYENPFEWPRDIRKVKSVGLAALAEPKKHKKSKRFQKGDNASIIFEVSANAKNAKPSELTKKLAAPRKNEGTEPKANAFSVKPAALKPLKPDKLEYYIKLSEPIKR